MNNYAIGGIINSDGSRTGAGDDGSPGYINTASSNSFGYNNSNQGRGFGIGVGAGIGFNVGTSWR